MKNTSNLLLILVSYLTALGVILFLVFAALPLHAQTATSTEVGTSNAVGAAAESQAVTSSVPASNAVAMTDNDSNLRALKQLKELSERMVPFIFLIAFFAIAYYFRHRRNKMVHETLRAMLEKGVPMTPEVIASLGEINNGGVWNRGTNRLLVGLILVGVGIGVTVTSGKSGLIPLLIGVAFLIVWLAERKNKNDAQLPKS